VVQPDQAAGKSSVKVDVFEGAVNPSDLVNKLKVGLTGPNAKYATLGADGEVIVKPQHERIAVAYTLTDPATGLAGEAFIVVPPSSDGTPPPKVKVPQQIVSMNGTKTWKLSQIIDVPSGRPAKLTGRSGVTTTHSTVSAYVDDQTITFTAQKDYRGPAAVTFKVNDGREPGASGDRVTSLVLPITVGNPDQSDVPPTFTPPNVTIEAGENPTSVDLRASSFHPNPEILNKLTYTDFLGASGGIVASPSGSTLSISAPFGVQPGTTATIHFKVNSPTISIDGSVNVKVVSSTRPLAQQKSPPETLDMKRGQSKTFPGAVSDSNWVNPFPGHALTITNAKQVSGPSGATVTFTSDSITVSAASGAGIGTVNVQYTVEDATKDPSRTAATIGQLNATIHDVPAQPSAPTAVQAGDGTINVTLSREPANNGKPIDHYVIYANGSNAKTVDSLGTYAISVTNGKAYTFSVVAVNSDGPSAMSPSSNSVTTYGNPAAVTHAKMSADGYAPNSFTLSWDKVTETGGGTVTYVYTFNGQTKSTSSTSVTTGNVSAGTYSFTVHAVNTGGKSGGSDSASGSMQNAPKNPSVTISKGNGPVFSDSCNSGCFYYLVSVKDFDPGSYTVHYTCNGPVSYTDTISVGSNGTGSLNSQNGSHFNCGYNNTYVTVNGVQSNQADFRNN
jgi:hypothetical protein